MRRRRFPDQAIQGCMQPQARHMQGTSVVIIHRPATPSSRRHVRHVRQPCSASGLYLARRQVSADPAIAPWLSRSIGNQDQPQPGIQCCPWRAISGLRSADSSTKTAHLTHCIDRTGPPAERSPRIKDALPDRDSRYAWRGGARRRTEGGHAASTSQMLGTRTDSALCPLDRALQPATRRHSVHPVRSGPHVVAAPAYARCVVHECMNGQLFGRPTLSVSSE